MNRNTLAIAAMSAMGMAMPLQASPTPINLGTRLHDLSAGSGGQVLQIDVNGDGENDLGFSYFEFAPGAQLAVVELIGLGRGLSDALDTGWPDLNASYPPVGPSNVLVEIPSGGSVISAVDAFAPGAALGGLAYNGLILDPDLLGDPSVSLFSGTRATNRDFYLGFTCRLVAGGPNHYGWVRCRLDWDGAGPIVEQWTVSAAAYESLPETDIAAGDAGAPPCVPDFDGQNGVTVNDVFVFLNAWFSGDSRADVDGQPGVSVNDIFTFLNLWFAGC